MKHRASCNTQSREGFTIVELLIVVVVIAILAAITIVSYNGITNRAHDTTVKTDATNAAKQLEIAKTTDGHYPILQGEFSTGFRFSKGSYSTVAHNVLYCLNITTDQYALGLISKSSKSYLIVNGNITENVSIDPTSVCAAVGATWMNDGVTTVTYHGYMQNTQSWNSGWIWTS